MKLRNSGFGAVGLILIVVIITVLGVSGFVGYRAYSNQADEPITSTEKPINSATKAPSEVSETTGTVITTGDSEFGTMLFNEKKQAIYIWELEESELAECYGNCAEAWPPVLTDGKPRANGEVNNELLGTTLRSDGSTQVTYNGHPLYYYAHEEAGEVKCHNISTHGGLWWVIQPSGVRAV
jgi:predicted lipoprotein with Yx(FWY)xxD motif